MQNFAVVSCWIRLIAPEIRLCSNVYFDMVHQVRKPLHQEKCLLVDVHRATE